MKPSRTWFVLLLSVSACGLFGGCEQLLYNLHPNQLWKLNRGPDIGSVGADFSVSDDEATARSGELRRQLRRQAGIQTSDALSE